MRQNELYSRFCRLVFFCKFPYLALAAWHKSAGLVWYISGTLRKPLPNLTVQFISSVSTKFGLNLGILAFSHAAQAAASAVRCSKVCGRLSAPRSPGDMIPMAEWRGCEHGRFERWKGEGCKAIE